VPSGKVCSSPPVPRLSSSMGTTGRNMPGSGVGVKVGVAVGLGVLVGRGVLVGLDVGVRVGGKGVWVDVGVLAGVSVDVGGAVAIGTGVAAGIQAITSSTMSEAKTASVALRGFLHIFMSSLGVLSSSAAPAAGRPPCPHRTHTRRCHRRCLGAGSHRADRS